MADQQPTLDAEPPTSNDGMPHHLSHAIEHLFFRQCPQMH